MAMPRWSKVIHTPDGGTMIVCHSGPPRPHRCEVCGKPYGIFQCDAPVQPGLDGPPRTCDRYLCVHCRVPAGVNIDYCPEHAAMAERAR